MKTTLTLFLSMMKVKEDGMISLLRYFDQLGCHAAFALTELPR
jgi:hypothetical protein